MNRRQRLGVALPAFIAFAVGLLTLFSLLMGGNPELYGFMEQPAVTAELVALPAAALVRLTALAIAFTVLIGLANLLYVHLERLARRRFYSLILLLSFAATMGWYMVSRGDTALLEAVQVPIESSLAALLFLSLMHGGATVLKRRQDGWGFLFAAVMLTVLLATLPLAELAPLRPWREWLMTVPVSAGARAMLIGIALATVTAGLRALLGQDRSYRG